MPRVPPHRLHPDLPAVPGHILARPAVQRAAVVLVYEALREVWRGRHGAALGTLERFDDHRLIRALVGDLRRRRRRVEKAARDEVVVAFAREARRLG